MECKKAQIISIGHIMGDSEFSPEQYQELQAHLAICPVCAEEYKGNKEAIEFVQEHKAEFATAFEYIDQQRAAEQAEIERSWKRIEAKLDKLETQEKRSKFRKLLIKTSVAAACLIISIFTWMIFSTHSTSKTTPEITLQQTVFEPKPSVKIELISEEGSSILADSQQIDSGNKLQTLLINGKHRMVMNARTSLLIEPLTVNAQLGCLVKLVNGQIYTHVKHDGNPFNVDTAQGQAVITGTTFDIKATKDSTTLVVTEGTVRFESEKGVVNVTAGQKSMSTANSKPTSPALCDVEMLTAWATGDKDIVDLTIAKSSSSKESDYKWPWPVEREAVALEDIDFEDWFEEKQSWFISEFPWIFQLQKALSKEGAEVGYHELLIQSGDLLKFLYLQDQPSRFSILSFDSLLKAASYYGFDKKWLSENVTAAKYALVNSNLPDETRDLLNAFKQWNNIFKTSQQSPNTVNYDILEHLFRASIYTANTRSLIWFAVKNGNYPLAGREQSEVLALLQQQVNTAIICKENVLYQPCKEKQLCDTALWPQDKWYEWSIVISENIEEIIDSEDKITKYEICK